VAHGVGKVLIVDDDPNIRRLARFILVDAGFDVLLAEDGLKALEILEQERPEVIVLDLQMPVMDGRDFFHSLKPGERPHILILSGDHADRARRELGADASLEKPFIPEDLVEKVAELSRAA
jgi:DNA-binding response OmpR family regulator